MRQKHYFIDIEDLGVESTRELVAIAVRGCDAMSVIIATYTNTPEMPPDATAARARLQELHPGEVEGAVQIDLSNTVALQDFIAFAPFSADAEVWMGGDRTGILSVVDSASIIADRVAYARLLRAGVSAEMWRETPQRGPSRRLSRRKRWTSGSRD